MTWILRTGGGQAPKTHISEYKPLYSFSRLENLLILCCESGPLVKVASPSPVKHQQCWRLLTDDNLTRDPRHVQAKKL